MNVIGRMFGPPLVTVDLSSARLPALAFAGLAAAVTRTSCLVTRFTARFMVTPAPLGDGFSVAFTVGGRTLLELKILSPDGVAPLPQSHTLPLLVE